MGRLNDRTYDRLLLALVFLAPLTMLALSKWRASLDSWYALPSSDSPEVFGKTFEERAAHWTRQQTGAGPKLIVIADPACPCTRAAISKLEEARALSARSQVQLSVRYIQDTEASEGSAWDALLTEIPATPTLLAIDGQRLVYAGPITSGSFCTTSVNRLLGLTALESGRNSPILNWLDRGCYCRRRHAQT